MEPSTRDGLVDWVRHWSVRVEVPITHLLAWLGIPASKYYNWCDRYGRLNAHNAPVPRWFWLLATEKQAILDFQGQQRYRQMLWIARHQAAILSVTKAALLAGCA